MKTIKGNKYVTIHFGINKYGLACARLVLGKNIRHIPTWRQSAAYHVLITDIANAQDIEAHLDEDGEAVIDNIPSELPVSLGYVSTKISLKFA